jgi:hypothetical protein
LKTKGSQEKRFILKFNNRKDSDFSMRRKF